VFCFSNLYAHTGEVGVYVGTRPENLEQALSAISPNTLSLRLKTLEEHGMLERRFYTEHPPRAEYLLTDKGRALGPALKALFEWCKKYSR